MIEAANVKKCYGSSVALSGVTLSLEPGINVITGPNGAGKTTLARLLASAEAPSSGCILFNGENLFENRAKFRRHISYLPDKAPLYRDLSVEGHLVYRGKLKGLSRRRLRARIRHVTDLIDLKPIYTRRISSLSAGQAKCVAIADAFLTDVRLLVIDEPFKELDERHSKLLVEALGGLSRHCCVILASHRTDLLSSVADRCFILSNGALAASLAVERGCDGASLKAMADEAMRKYYLAAPEAK